MKIISSDKTYISKSKIHLAGRGVFANADIKRGEIIEKCPFIEIPKHDLASLGESILVTYLYFFGKDKERLLIALGFGSIYNHDSSPNAVYKIKSKEKEMEFVSTRKIKKDEEITVNYNQGNRQSSPLWFEL